MVHLAARKGARLAHIIHVPPAVRRGLRVLCLDAGHAALPGLREGLRYNVCAAAPRRRPGSGIRLPHFGKRRMRVLANSALALVAKSI